MAAVKLSISNIPQKIAENWLYKTVFNIMRILEQKFNKCQIDFKELEEMGVVYEYMEDLGMTAIGIVEIRIFKADRVTDNVSANDALFAGGYDYSNKNSFIDFVNDDDFDDFEDDEDEYEDEDDEFYIFNNRFPRF